MNNYYFYPSDKLPKGFKFPEDYLREVVGGRDFGSWWFAGINQVFADLCLDVINEDSQGRYFWVPFAKCSKSLDVACFDGNDFSGNPRVFFYTNKAISKEFDLNKRFYLDDFSSWCEHIKKY